MTMRFRMNANTTPSWLKNPPNPEYEKLWDDTALVTDGLASALEKEGFHRFTFQERDRPGFMADTAVPAFGGRCYTEIQWVDRDGVDLRPQVARIAATLEKLGIAHTALWDEPYEGAPFGIPYLRVYGAEHVSHARAPRDGLDALDGRDTGDEQ